MVIKPQISTEELQKIFATSPAPDCMLMQSELDAIFGEDRIDDESR